METNNSNHARRFNYTIFDVTFIHSHSSLKSSRVIQETSSKYFFGPTKNPRKKILDSQNTNKKKFRTNKMSTKKNYIYEITTRKNIGPSNYRREDILDPRNTHEKNVWIHEARWHETHDCKGPTEFSTLRLIDG